MGCIVQINRVQPLLNPRDWIKCLKAAHWIWSNIIIHFKAWFSLAPIMLCGKCRHGKAEVAPYFLHCLNILVTIVWLALNKIWDAWFWPLLNMAENVNQWCYGKEEGNQKVSRNMTKPTKCLCAKRRLRWAWACAQSDQSLLCAQWVAKDPRFLHADSEDPDQTGLMPRLIWVFVGHTLILLVLSCRGSNSCLTWWCSSSWVRLELTKWTRGRGISISCRDNEKLLDIDFVRHISCLFLQQKLGGIF